MIRSLYLSHTGMTEPLGRSQVIPYLVRLARASVRIHIIAFEPPGTSQSDVDAVRALLAAEGIGYEPMSRSARHGLGTKAAEISQAIAAGARAAARFRPDIVHCRSYVPTAAGDALASFMPGAKLLFDCRGMLGDEYVDAGHWRRDEPRYRILKRAESRFFRRAEGVVVLTSALADWLRARSKTGPATSLEVVPCCVDTDRFVVSETTRASIRAARGFGDDPVIVYSGTLGAWYRADEMAELVTAAHRRDARVRFMVLTRADTAALSRSLERRGFPASRVHVEAVHPDHMPRMLSAGDVGLSFIEPCFSKLGSSPTKIAEYLACGLTVVANEGVGDVAELRDERACVTIPELDPATIAVAADRMLEAITSPFGERAETSAKVARRRFGLDEVGGPRYLALYEALVHGRAAGAGRAP